MQMKLEDSTPQPTRIRVPFLSEETGLGDVIAKATSALGVKPCKPCTERAERLNERVVFSPWET